MLLLVPLCVLSLMFLLLLWIWGRREGQARSAATAMPVIAGLALIWLCTFLAVPTLVGDALQYAGSFSELRSMPLSRALAQGGFDLFFTIVQWVVGQVSSSPFALFAVILLIYMSVFVFAQIRLAGYAGAAMLVMLHLGYPDFVTYADNTIRQGVGMVFLLAGIVELSKKSWRGWVWVILAPFWHSGIWLAVAVIAAHQVLCAVIHREKTRWLAVSFAFIGAISLSFLGSNQGFVTSLLGSVTINQRYDVYLGSNDFGYRTGFRYDFLAFSLLPLITAFALRHKAAVFDYKRAGWWLSLYLSLNVIYHLFSFAPFSNRFADFSWFLLPTIIFCQVRETNSRRLMVLFITSSVLINLIMLGTYTGSYVPNTAGL